MKSTEAKLQCICNETRLFTLVSSMYYVALLHGSSYHANVASVVMFLTYLRKKLLDGDYANNLFLWYSAWHFWYKAASYWSCTSKFLSLDLLRYFNWCDFLSLQQSPNMRFKLINRQSILFILTVVFSFNNNAKLVVKDLLLRRPWIDVYFPSQMNMFWHKCSNTLLFIYKCQILLS
jgi:hypothetical protein